MNTNPVKSIKVYASALAATFLFVAATGHAQSAYSNAVMALNPVAYWPLQENVQPPAYDTETNIGSLGPVANGYYYSSAAVATNTGAVGDGDGSRWFPSGNNKGLLVPTRDNRASLSAGQPFTVECWVRPGGATTFAGIVNETAGIGSGGLNGTANDFGWSLVQGYLAYRGTGSGNNPPIFGFHVFNGQSNLGGAEADVTNAVSGAGNEWLNGNYPNSWLYLVGVFDGTNALLYMFSTNLTAAYSGTNAMDYQCPITSSGGQVPFTAPTLLPSAQFMPDYWDPIYFGQTRGYTGNGNWSGNIDEVAIYTNALTFLQVSNHYAAATNGVGNYKATILADNPLMYWRMDAPFWNYVPPSSCPTAKNYGSAQFIMTNLTTGATGPNCAIYQPGTVPGVAGPSFVGFGPFTNACAFNGLVGAVDAGYTPSMDPTGAVANFSLVGWYKGDPMDTVSSRFNVLASHTDKSWKAQFQLGNAKAYKGVGGQPNIAPTATLNPNDGKWHMYTLVSSAVNGGTGTNVSVYLDSGIISATVANQSPIPGTNGFDAWIGGAPDPTYMEPTNEATYNASQQYFAGEISQVAFFTNALTFDQIQNLFFTAQPAPVISKQPVGGIADLGGAFTNTVGVQGTGPFFYQWYTTNSGSISGATSPTYIINPVTTTSGGGFYVIITNVYGSATSLVANVTVVSNLTISGQFPITYVSPMTLYGGTNISGTNYLGSTPTFAVNAAGATPIYYQWFTNGVAVGGANNSSFTVTNCQLSSPTNFNCIITNIFGSATSMTWFASYVPTTTAPFPQQVLAYQPIGYWRLNESPDNGSGNIGTICNDYQSGNNGLYTNVVLADVDSFIYPIYGYNPVTDPMETSTLFGALTNGNQQDYAGGIGTNIDFATPAGGNGEFAVAVWANGGGGNINSPYIHGQIGNAGLVTKGHWGAEQFDLDTGSSTANCLRFVVRDAATGNYYAANSSVNLGNDATWHYVVAICDEANSQLLLYVDGQLVASGTIPAGNGILSVGPVKMMFGARDNGSGLLGGIQYNGWLDDVEVYNYALTSSQVVALYNSAGIPAFFIQQPVTSINADGGGTLVIPASVGGTPLLTMQWFDENANSYIPGQTSNTLVVPNITTSDTYYLTASNNIEGTGYLTNSVQVSVTVYDGMPHVTSDVTNPFYALPGQTAKNAAMVYGALPLAYQWQFYSATGWANLADNGRISGSLTSALTIGNVQGTDPGNYQLVITNIYGATTSSVATLIVQGVLPLGFGNGAGWVAGGGASMSSGVLTLSGSGIASPSDYFFQIPQYIGAFEASFTYQAQYESTYPLADGTTFCLQNDPRGTSATGGGGGELGYEGITPSAALQLNIFTGNGLGGMGYAFGYNGSVGQTTYPGGVNLTNGAVQVSMLYVNGQVSLTFSNELSSAVFSTNIYVGSIPQDLGSYTALVGFTGAVGGDNSIQTVQNFQFVSIPPQAIQKVGNNVTIAWPGSIVGNYTVQENSSINTTNWVNVTNVTPAVINGLNQATVPTGGSNQQYYRLILSQP
jgi:hypothetical protein